MKYLLDANVFIRSKNLEYGFDFCPAFWEWLVVQNASGNVHSIQKVSEELTASADELGTWATERGDGFFLPPPPDIGAGFGRVSGWVNTQDYEPAAKAQFVQVADYYLVAHALVTATTVVTHEIPSGSKRRIKIPDVCLGLQIRCMTPYQVLRAERARFVLPAQASGRALLGTE